MGVLNEKRCKNMKKVEDLAQPFSKVENNKLQ